MQGYIETLIIKDAAIDVAERGKYLKIIMDSSRKLSHLVSQLFEYSKLEARQIQPKKEPFFVNELASDILMKFHMLAAQKKISLKLDAEESLPLVFADVALVERVIQNLMDNALKFSPIGGEVYISLKNQEKGVEVCVTDNGHGIHEKDQAYIFERYKKSFNGQSSENKGAGLGLAIVKKILELHNVTINVKSSPVIGSSFWFQLPVYQ
jgi:signal transduction histidine kinase